MNLPPWREPVSPYRVAAGRVMPCCVRYWPRLGFWPFALALLVALPVAWAARCESRIASTVSCASAGDDGRAPSCTVRDARAGSTERIACAETPAALATFLDPGNPFSRPLVAATVDVVDPGDARRSRFVDGPTLAGPQVGPGARAVHAATHTASPPLVRPKPNEGGDVASGDAGALLAACVAREPRAEERARTVSIAVFERDFTASAAVLGVALLAALVWVARRRVAVTVDPSGRVDVVERGLLRTGARWSMVAGDFVEAVVASGARGPFSAARIEVVRRDGARVPLTTELAPLTSVAQARVAERLNHAVRPYA